MSTHKHIDKICLVAAIIAFVVCTVLINSKALGIQPTSKTIAYENRLFDTSKVHTIDIIIDDWDEFISTAQSEEYSICDLVIDGEAISNVGIRGKGNTSLSTVSSMDSERYSFKIEFDQYDKTKTYHGLDKLSLNNIIQDNTYMKDYLSYQMMNDFGVAAPLCSYAYITVNGEDWGLYLAVEAVEESFLQRNYGSNYGELYKPDSMNMGGGRGNGRDFDMSNFMDDQQSPEDTADDSGTDNSKSGRVERDEMTIPGMPPDMGGSIPFGGMSFPENMPNGGGGGGMYFSETKLQYIDDDPASYSTIFDSAKTDVTADDQIRLIASLKQLSEYENLEEVLIIDDVLRYFVVHNYVVNGDSYTGSMIHNYYLYEEAGRLSMIPWDYNLAFGTFQGNDASSAVNNDIDDVLSDRPMQAWIFSAEAYSQQYYALYAELLEQVDIQAIIDNAYQLIAPYVKKDPTSFCTYEEFLTGVEALKEFCMLRSESVQLQLSGSTEYIDVGRLDLSDMGTMNMGGMGGGHGDFAGRGNLNMLPPDSMHMPNDMWISGNIQQPGEILPPDDTGTSAHDDIMQDNSNQAKDSVIEWSLKNDPTNIIGGFDNIKGENINTSTYVLLAVSILFLTAGMIVARKFKR